MHRTDNGGGTERPCDVDDGPDKVSGALPHGGIWVGEREFFNDPAAAGAHSRNGKMMFHHDGAHGGDIERDGVRREDLHCIESEGSGLRARVVHAVPIDKRASPGLRHERECNGGAHRGSVLDSVATVTRKNHYDKKISAAGDSHSSSARAWPSRKTADRQARTDRDVRHASGCPPSPSLPRDA